jgi:hypothetical protein
MSAIRNPLGDPQACAAAHALITPAIVDEAHEILRNAWDFHPRSTLPDGYLLLSLTGGIWIVEDGCYLNDVKRLAKVIDEPPRWLDRRLEDDV